MKAKEVGLQGLVRVCDALAEPARLRLLLLLVQGERSVGDLCYTLRLPRYTVTHHLRHLLGHRLVSRRRQWKQAYYSISKRVEIDAVKGRIVIEADGHALQVTASWHGGLRYVTA